MNNKIAYEILLVAPSFLAHEDGKNIGLKRCDEFVCNAISLAGESLEVFDPEEVGLTVEKLRQEVEDMINGAPHLQEFLCEQLGVSWSIMTPAFLQPIRRGMLDKLLRKYRKYN